MLLSRGRLRNVACFNFGIQGNKNSKYENGYRRHSCTSKTAKIHRFVRFVMYCIITTCSVECYWHCNDGTVHSVLFL